MCNFNSIVLQNIQKALYQYLSQNLNVKVEDKINLDTAKPYVAMADINLSRESARSLEGFEVRQELLIYSNFNGKDEVIKIADEIRFLLQDKQIEIESVNVHTQAIVNINISQMDVAIYEGQIMLTLTIFDY